MSRSGTMLACAIALGIGCGTGCGHGKQIAQPVKSTGEVAGGGATRKSGGENLAPGKGNPDDRAAVTVADGADQAATFTTNPETSGDDVKAKQRPAAKTPDGKAQAKSVPLQSWSRAPGGSAWHKEHVHSTKEPKIVPNRGKTSVTNAVSTT